MEAGRFAAEILDRPELTRPGSAVLVVGCGWGYLLEALRAKVPAGEPAPFYFFEPRPEIAATLLSADRERTLSALYPGRFFYDAAALATALRAARAHGEISGLQIEVTPAYRRLFSDLGTTMESLVRDALGQVSLDRATIGRFFLRWGWNFVRRLAGRDSIRYLTGLAGSGEFVYCGAGPGLLADLAVLGDPPDQAGLFVIAADTALAPLLAHGIRPDLVLSVDSGPGTEYHFRALEHWLGSPGAGGAGPQGLRLPLSVPVLTWNAGPACLPLFFANIFTYRSTFPLDQVLGAGPLAAIPEWRNLSRNTMGLALHLAALAGQTALYTAGADFRSKAGESHTRGTGYALFALERGSRLRPPGNYRPGGYHAGLTPKNREIVAGLERMSAELGVRLLSARALAGASRTADTQVHFFHEDRNAESLRDFVLENWSALPVGELVAETGLSVNELRRAREKWFSILKNGGQGYLL